MRLIFQLKVTISIFHSHSESFYFPINIITAKVISVKFLKLGKIKIMKLELKIEAPGVQVYAYEIDEETKELLLKKMLIMFLRKLEYLNWMKQKKNA